MGSELPGGLKRVAPEGDAVTDYDRAHFLRYIRLLDAHSAGLNSDEMCRTILEIDPATDPERSRGTLRSHLDRAVWMSSVGFRQI